MEEKPIGKVIHFFGRINVAAIELQEELKIGETIRIKGKTTDFTQKIDSIQIEHKEVKEASPGDKIGIKVQERVRPKDIVYKVID
jgi:translation elongation factor EF-1alpha